MSFDIQEAASLAARFKKRVHLHEWARIEEKSEPTCGCLDCAEWSAVVRMLHEAIDIEVQRRNAEQLLENAYTELKQHANDSECQLGISIDLPRNGHGP